MTNKYKAMLGFRAVVGNAQICSVCVNNIANVNHAEFIAQGMIGSLSIKHGIALYAGSVQLNDGKSFSAMPAPEYWREGTNIISETEFYAEPEFIEYMSSDKYNTWRSRLNE